MISWKRRLYRERRRLIAIALMSFIAGLVLGMNDDRVLFGIPFQVVYGLAFVAILTPVLMIIALVFPSIRNTTESVAFSLPFVCWMKQYGTSSDGAALQNVIAVLSILFLYLVFAVYAGGWLDRYLPARRRTFFSKVKTGLSPEELWPFMVVTPDTVDTYGGQKTVSMTWVDPGVSFVETEQFDDHSRIEEMTTIETCEPDTHFRGRFESLSSKADANGKSGVLERKFNKASKGTQLVSSRSYDRSSPIMAFRLWLDDSFGRFDDEYVLRAEQLSGL
jgi:hypothetical protein